MTHGTRCALAAVALAVFLVPSVASAQARALTVSPRSAPQMLEVGVTPDVRCREVTGTRCQGHLSSRAIPIVVRRSTVVEIEVTRANINPILALVGPSGSHYDNSSGRGNLSKLRLHLAPGTHYLYVGTRNRRHVGQASVVITPQRSAPRVIVTPVRPVTPPPFVVTPVRPGPPPVVVPGPPARPPHVYDSPRRSRRGTRVMSL